MKAIAMLEQDRALLGRTLDGLTGPQLRYVPPGFRNNILWNLGHIVVTQQLLHYRLAGQELHVPESFVALFRSGTSPADWETMPDAAHLKALLFTLPDRLQEDYAQERFGHFKRYTTSTGVTLADIDDAILFNSFHEGMHTGVIASLKKLALAHLPNDAH